MWRLLRIVLVSLLAVTLPLKGIAAVSMAACGEHTALAGQGGHAHGMAPADPATESAQGQPLGHASLVGDQAHTPHDDGASHDHGVAHGEHGTHAAHAAQFDDADQGGAADPGVHSHDGDRADHHHADAGKTKCSACAPCCAAAAPGFAGLGLAHAEQATRAAILEDQPLPGVTVALLHRPPILPVV